MHCLLLPDDSNQLGNSSSNALNRSTDRQPTWDLNSTWQDWYEYAVVQWCYFEEKKEKREIIYIVNYHFMVSILILRLLHCGEKSFSMFSQKVLKINGGEGCTLWMPLVPVNCTHKEVKMVNFLLCICYHNKKIGLLYPTYMPFMLCIVFLALMVLFISYLLLTFTTSNWTDVKERHVYKS